MTRPSLLDLWDLWLSDPAGRRSAEEPLSLSPETLLTTTIAEVATEAAASPPPLADSPPTAQPSLLSAPGADEAPPTPAPEAGGVATKGRYIVFLEHAPGVGGVEERASGLLRSLGLKGLPVIVYEHLGGFVLDLDESEAQRLRALGGLRVEADAEVFLEPPMPAGPPPAASGRGTSSTAALTVYGNGTAASGEILPWGALAVYQGNDISAAGDVAAGTYAFVIDSGVLNTTGDLHLAPDEWHSSWIAGETPFTDGNGHGTHVAGTLAARANGLGVVGVAPGANVVSLKVFDSSGSGFVSTIIAAINDAVEKINGNGLDKSKVVINLSLGGGYNASLDAAVRAAADQGIRMVVAAGNSGLDADNFSPAAAGDHPNVFTISAVDSNYEMPSWTNWDKLDRRDGVDDVNFAAPGVSVLSYYQNGALAYLSGTSMAAPHVAGLLLTGGVQPGDPVIPFRKGTADPFAWGIAPVAGGSGGSGDAPPPEDPPATSTTAVVWGTTDSDTITGGSGDERLAGVPETGTSPEALGGGQIDVITGNEGFDVFLLGDGRGVFYDDRDRRNLGIVDYAWIMDFTPGEDRLQVSNGSYLYTVSDGALSLYWDRNANGSLNTAGRNQDELIAVLQGVTSLTTADLVVV